MPVAPEAHTVTDGVGTVLGLRLDGAEVPATVDEAVGWPIIMGMFLTIPAIFVIVIVLKLFRVK